MTNKTYFISDTSELRNYISVTEGFEFKELIPYLEPAAITHLRNDLGIGAALFDEILNEYNNGYESLSDIKKNLIHHIRYVVTKFAVHNYVPIGITIIGADGISNINKDNRQPIRKWQKDELQQQLITEGFEAVERLLQFLEANKTSFPSWTASNAYTISKNQFVNSVDEFTQKYSLVRSRRTFLFLMPIIKRVDEIQLKEVLGETLYTTIKSEILSGTVSPDNKILLNFIQSALVNLVMHIAFDQLTISINDHGIQIFSQASNTENSLESNSISEIHLQRLKTEAETTANLYLQKITKILNPNTSDMSGSRKNDSDSKSYYV
jgi:hypothetical protein